MLIAALSGRALATCREARRAIGRWSPTCSAISTRRTLPQRACACPAVWRAASVALRIAGRRSTGWPPGGADSGLVMGAGFEDRPAAAALPSARGMGCSAMRRRRCAPSSGPLRFAAMCARDGHCASGVRAATARWRRVAAQARGRLRRRACRAGRARRRARRGRYRQRQVEPAAGLGACSLRRRHAVVCSALAPQWTDPTPGRPFRYGGAVRPAPSRRRARGVDVRTR